MMVELFTGGHGLFKPEAVQDEAGLKKWWVQQGGARLTVNHASAFLTRDQESTAGFVPTRLSP